MLPRGAQAPSGAVYAVVLREIDAIAWCRDMGVVLEALAHFAGHPLDVVRVEDNRTIWPWMTRGGTA